MKTSIYQVAQSAGVSPSTVSRVMNGSRSISKMTSQRVMAEMGASGYVIRARLQRQGPRGQPNNERRLCVVGNAGHDALQAEVYQQALNGIYHACKFYGYKVLYRTNSSKSRELPGGMYGYIILGGKHDITTKRSPLVRVMGSTAHLTAGDWIGYDDALVGEIAYEQLIASGVSRLILVNEIENRATRKRCAAFRERANSERVKLSDISVHLRVTKRGAYTTEASALEPIRPLVKCCHGEKIGIFIAEDIHVPAVVTLCENESTCTADQLSIVTVNHTRVTGQFGRDLLRTIDINPFEIGERAVAQVEWRESHEDEPPRTMLIVPRLV